MVLDSLVVKALPNNSEYTEVGFSFSIVAGPSTKAGSETNFICICDSKDTKAFWFTILSNTVKNFAENKQNYPKLIVTTFRV